MNSRSRLQAGVWELAWALLLGVASSLACVAVRLLFRLMQRLITGYAGSLPQAAGSLPPWLRVVVPTAGAMAAMLVLWCGHRFQHGGKFQEYVVAVRYNGGRIAFLPTLIKTVSSAFSVASGAAIGREGSMIQFATATTSWFARRRSLSQIPLDTQVACGVAAAVAAAYQAPIAAVFFAMEIVLGKLSMRTVPLLLVASLAGNAVGGWLLRKGPLFNVSGQPEIAFGWDRALWLVALLAPFMGLLGPLYYRLIHSFRPMRAWPFALAWSGMLVGLLSLKCPQVWGNGDVALLGITHSSTALLTLTLILGLRLIATAACVGAGTVGGVFTPTLFAGGAIGYLAASLLHIPNPAIFAILAMAAFLAAVTHAPLMAAFMTVELTGQWRFLPLILGSTFVAVFVARRLSPQSLYAIATPTPEEDEAESRQPMRALRLHLEPAAAVQPPADRTLDSSRTPVEALRGN